MHSWVANIGYSIILHFVLNNTLELFL